MRHVPNPISVAVTSNTDNGYIRKRSTFTLGKGGHLKMTKLILEEIRAGAVVTVERINEDENEGTVPEHSPNWGRLDTQAGGWDERWPLGGYE